MARITKCEAKKLAKKAGWNFKKDFHQQNSMAKSSDLLAIAKLKGYRKSKNASGSTSRLFFQYLERVKSC